MGLGDSGRSKRPRMAARGSHTFRARKSAAPSMRDRSMSVNNNRHRTLATKHYATTRTTSLSATWKGGYAPTSPHPWIGI